MSKTTTVIFFIFIVCAGLIAIVVLQIPTIITKPATDFIKSATTLDMAVTKDKVIGALTGSSALSIGGLTAVAYGFWNRGKQLAAEIKSKLKFQEQTDSYIKGLEEDRTVLAAQSQSALDKLAKEKEELGLQVQDYKMQAESLFEQKNRLLIEQQAKVKQNIADFTQTLPGEAIALDPTTGNMIKTVPKVVIK